MKNRNLYTNFTLAVGAFLLSVCPAFGQETTPKTNPTPAPAVQTSRKQSPRRVSSVKLTDVDTDTSLVAPTAPVAPVSTKSDSGAENSDKSAVGQVVRLDPKEAEKKEKLESELEREKDKAVAEARAEVEAKAKVEAAARQAEFAAKQAELEAKQKETEESAAAEKARMEAEFEKARIKAEAEAAEMRQSAENEKRVMEEQAASDKSRLEQERVKREKQVEADRLKREKQDSDERLERERQAENERLEREKLAATERETRERLEAEAAAKQAAMQLEIETQRAAAQLAQEQAEASSAARLVAETSAKTENEKIRRSLIEQTARTLNYLKPEEAVSLVPNDLLTAPQIESFLSAEAKKDESLVKVVDYCNTAFKGEPFSYTGTADVTLGDFLDLLGNQYRVDFVPDADVLALPIRLSVNNKRWNSVLRSQLDLLDVQATCDGGIISLVKRQKYLAQQEVNRKSAPLKTELIRLQHLRVAAGKQVDLSGKSNSSDPIQTLEQKLQKIIETGGDNRGTVAQIPGRAEFFIKATEDQLRDIRQQITLADRPRYRVDVFGLIYVINENKLKDIGSQLSVILSNGGLTRSGGLTTLPQPTTGTGTGGTGGTTTSTTGFPGGFTSPSGSLGAGAASTIVGANVNVGIAEFRYQLSLLEQFGVARSIEKPFVSAKDGSTSVYDNGTKIPVVIQALNNFGGGGSGGSISYINAGTSLSVSPQIAFDENDKPKSVSLNLRLESNTPNTSIQTSGNIPAVNSRSIQLDDVTFLPGQAFIFGGSTIRLESYTVSQTPGLGELPFFKNFFRRKNKQVNDDQIYFAVTVQISEDDGSSPVNPLNLDTSFAAPPPMNQPLRPTKVN